MFLNQARWLARRFYPAVNNQSNWLRAGVKKEDGSSYPAPLDRPLEPFMLMPLAKFYKMAEGDEQAATAAAAEEGDIEEFRREARVPADMMFVPYGAPCK